MARAHAHAYAFTRANTNQQFAKGISQKYLVDRRLSILQHMPSRLITYLMHASVTPSQTDSQPSFSFEIKHFTDKSIL